MGKIRIAFFADILKENFDGVSNTLHQIIKRIPLDRIDPIFITPHPPEDENFPFKVIRCPFVPFPLHDEYRLAIPWKMNIKQVLEDFDPQIIHWTSPSLLGEFAIRYARKHGIKIATIYHTHFPTYLEYYVRWLPKANYTLGPVMELFYKMYRRTDLILVPTISLVDFLQSKKVHRNHMKIWGRGVDSNFFHPKKRSKEFINRLAPEETKLILFVSRLVKEKETKTLRHFYKLLENYGSDYKLLIVGDGPERARLEKELNGALFLGKMGREKLSVIFASADVFIFPSVTETFGNVILEAFASGLPVVAANAGGPSDIIEDEVTGLLAKPKDAEEMLKQVIRVLEDPDLSNLISIHARSYAEEQNWEDLCEDLFEHYEKLIAFNSESTLG